MMNGIYGFLQYSAQLYPDKPFIQQSDRVWTYNEVLNITRHVAALLLDRGIRKGDRLIIFCDNSIQYIAAFFGSLKIGAIAVPVNPVKTAGSISCIIEQCTPMLILSCDRTAAQLNKVDGMLSAMRPKMLNLDRSEMFCDPPHASINVQIPDCDIDENEAAEILFTSGTTANPKGVTLTHANLTANTMAIVQYLNLTDEDSVLMTLPFSYSYGNSILLTHAYAGATIILEDSAAFPYRVLEGIKKQKVTGFSTVGSYANLMLKCLRNSDQDEGFLDSLRYITFAGEATNTDDICFIRENFPHIQVYVMYGQTEASARLSYLAPEMLGDKLGSIGKGLCNVELRVVDETGMNIRPGEVGEIIARGPSIMKGYWKDAAATEEVLIDGWLHTGDSATIDEDGFVYIKGRKSDMIKYMGHRISPVEIENVINRCSNVKECAVIESVIHQAQVIKACIVLDGEGRIDEVRNFVFSQLPAYMRPQVFEAVCQLPKTDSGKIMRSSLRKV